MFDRKKFETEKYKNAEAQSHDQLLQKSALDLIINADKYSYAHQWMWLGMPIIQLPQDIMVSQDIIWETKPNVIIETGIAWGGSVVFHAALLSLIGKEGKVIAIDKVIMPHIREEILKFPFSSRIVLIEGDSCDPEIIKETESHILDTDSVAVFLDSDHTHNHVLKELRVYGRLVSVGQYLNVYATAIEDLPVPNRQRPWGLGNNPKTAIKEFLRENSNFRIDSQRDAKALGSFIPEGRLICIA